MPRVDVLYFSSLRLALGLERESFDLASPSHHRDILRSIADAHPAQASAILGARLAVDRSFVAGDITLREGAEIAVITPVSGG